MGPQRIFGMTPWVRRLFVANLVVFLFQMTIFVDPRFLSTFGFVPLRALAQPWSFVTYMFLHGGPLDRKSTRLNSSHVRISYAVFCLKKKKLEPPREYRADRTPA